MQEGEWRSGEAEQGKQEEGGGGMGQTVEVPAPKEPPVFKKDKFLERHSQRDPF